MGSHCLLAAHRKYTLFYRVHVAENRPQRKSVCNSLHALVVQNTLDPLAMITDPDLRPQRVVRSSCNVHAHLDLDSSQSRADLVIGAIEALINAHHSQYVYLNQLRYQRSRWLGHLLARLP